MNHSKHAHCALAALRALRRAILPILAVLAISAGLPSPARAQQGYPNRTVTLISPYPPGGLADQVARQLAAHLTKLWNQSVIVDTRPGASGNIAAGVVANASIDGYTLLYTIADSLAITKASGAKTAFDPVKDLEPVALAALGSSVWVTGASSPFQTFQEYVDYARNNPGKLTFGSQGTGSAYHLALEQFNVMAKVDILHVPYKSAAPAITDILAGRLDSMIVTTGVALEFIKSGKLRALAIATKAPIKQLPGVPTIASLGYAGYDNPVTLGVFARAGTPKALVDKINADIRTAMHDPALVQLLDQQATQVTDLSADEYRKNFNDSIASMRKLIKEADIKFE